MIRQVFHCANTTQNTHTGWQLIDCEVGHDLDLSNTESQGHRSTSKVMVKSFDVSSIKTLTMQATCGVVITLILLT